MSAACRYCGHSVKSGGRGRPPLYCSVGCRRASEYEIRRLSRRLERLEDMQDALGRESALLEAEYAAGETTTWHIERQRRQAATLAEQILAHRDRMRSLLDDPPKR